MSKIRIAIACSVPQALGGGSDELTDRLGVIGAREEAF
jgi:hypothetical protein